MAEGFSLLERRVSRRKLAAMGAGGLAAAAFAALLSGDGKRHSPGGAAAAAEGPAPDGKEVYALPSPDHGDGIRSRCRCARCLRMDAGDSRLA
jgi:hypothetical protein